MKEKDVLVCPRDGGTPQCQDHPRRCPLKTPDGYDINTIISLEGVHAPDEPLPEDILHKIKQTGSIKAIR